MAAWRVSVNTTRSVSPDMSNTHLNPPVAGVRILIVLDDSAVRSALERILSHSTWDIQIVANSGDAAAALHRPGTGVVVTERHCWKELLDVTRRLEHPPRLIVTDPLAEESLWAEVLNLGGYDLLAQPFNPQEVFRVLSLAWLSWKDAGRYGGTPKRSSTAASLGYARRCVV